MKLKVLFALLLFFNLFFLSNCKKGPDDPAIVFLTRKARLTGNWNLKHGNANITYKEVTTPTINDAFSFEGTSLTLNETETSGPPIIYKGSYSLNLKFDKKGKFEMQENFGGSLFSATGTWNFTGRVGDNKNKEEIILIINSVTTGISDEHIFNKFRTEFTYKIRELRNKYIVLESATKPYINANGQAIVYTSQYTFTQ